MRDSRNFAKKKVTFDSRISAGKSMSKLIWFMHYWRHAWQRTGGGGMGGCDQVWYEVDGWKWVVELMIDESDGGDWTRWMPSFVCVLIFHSSKCAVSCDALLPIQHSFGWVHFHGRSWSSVISNHCPDCVCPRSHRHYYCAPEDLHVFICNIHVRFA